ncbi:unnamed protein product [Caenorhabditis auriculariae]|uniref:Uncharacterized protein n=1 Tax=Caenorhabditis auriculariae TaxID=2777116 RepID=A0A8S1GNL6_9PELO|nr:unnamed protein product [Caenorhabditis auriculariae]
MVAQLSLAVFCGIFGAVTAGLSAQQRGKVDVSMGTIKDSAQYGAMPYFEIPVDGQKLTVPKSFYHYSEREMAANAKFGVPDEAELIETDTLFVDNRKEINGLYLPLPNMEPINLHFINQRTFEKGLDTTAHEESPSSFLHQAKTICRSKSERECEAALLKYHRAKSHQLRRERQPLHEQLLTLGELSSSAKVRDREGEGLGVVVGVPGYDPLYLGAALGHDNSHDLKVRFSPPS